MSSRHQIATLGVQQSTPGDGFFEEHRNESSG
jgi:hypothetical protein